MKAGIDTYIWNAQPFAQPILKRLRAIIHDVGENIEETIKWGSPVYVCEGNLCMTWAFKSHAAIVFFKGALIDDRYHALIEAEGGNVSSRNIRYLKESDIDEKVLRDYLNQAIAINKKGMKVQLVKKEPLVIPTEFNRLLKKYKTKERKFQHLAPSHQREYVQAFVNAKKEETKLRRFEKMIENLRKMD